MLCGAFSRDCAVTSNRSRLQGRKKMHRPSCSCKAALFLQKKKMAVNNHLFCFLLSWSRAGTAINLHSLFRKRLFQRRRSRERRFQRSRDFPQYSGFEEGRRFPKRNRSGCRQKRSHSVSLPKTNRPACRRKNRLSYQRRHCLLCRKRNSLPHRTRNVPRNGGFPESFRALSPLFPTRRKWPQAEPERCICCPRSS